MKQALQRYVLKNKKTMEIELDYVNLAKSNNIANPIVKLLEQCQVEFNSFNKKQMSVIHKEKLDTIDKNIFKSVNSYLDYVELSNKNAENNIKTDADNNLKETIILCHQSIVGVREEIFKEMVEELEKDKVKARARNSY